MALKRVTDLLDAQHIRYALIRHSAAYTAQEIAEAAHISGRQLAKTVIVKIDDRLAMAVTRGPEPVNTEALRAAAGAQQVVLAVEDEFAARFPDCEVGAMPPFGHLYDMDVFVSTTLARDDSICFNAGNHHELIQMPFDAYQQLANPVLAEF